MIFLIFRGSFGAALRSAAVVAFFFNEKSLFVLESPLSVEEGKEEEKELSLRD